MGGTKKLNSNSSEDERGTQNTDKDTIIEIDPRTLLPNPYQIRLASDMSGPAFDSLMESIRKMGMIELLIIRKTKKGYQIEAGHRRVAACRIE